MTMSAAAAAATQQQYRQADGPAGTVPAVHVLDKQRGGDAQPGADLGDAYTFG